MLALSPSQRILLAVQPVDFRKGIDGLIGFCRQRLNENPLLGTLFVFTNRRRTALKLLIYDGQGFFLILKRFSQGRLRWWPDGPETGHALAARELRSEEHTSELQSRANLVCRPLLEKNNQTMC